VRKHGKYGAKANIAAYRPGPLFAVNGEIMGTFEADAGHIKDYYYKRRRVVGEIWFFDGKRPV
jgi:hypothetical protein